MDTAGEVIFLYDRGRFGEDGDDGADDDRATSAGDSLRSGYNVYLPCISG